MSRLRRDVAALASLLRSSGVAASLRAVCEALLWRFYPPKRRLAKQERTLLSRDREWDQAHGVETCGDVDLLAAGVSPAQASRGNNVYRPIHSDFFVDAMAMLGIDYRDYVFVDYGSGKGKALLLASEFPFREILGVEYAPALNDSAAKNIAAYRSPTQQCQSIRTLFADAELFQPPPQPLVCFFFNPFGADTLRRVLAGLEQSWKQTRRPILIVYTNHRDVREKIDIFIEQTSLNTLHIKKNIAIFGFAA